MTDVMIHDPRSKMGKIERYIKDRENYTRKFDAKMDRALILELAPLYQPTLNLNDPIPDWIIRRTGYLYNLVREEVELGLREVFRRRLIGKGFTPESVDKAMKLLEEENTPLTQYHWRLFPPFTDEDEE